jgi:hypothetical protein
MPYPTHYGRKPLTPWRKPMSPILKERLIAKEVSHICRRVKTKTQDPETTHRYDSAHLFNIAPNQRAED